MRDVVVLLVGIIGLGLPAKVPERSGRVLRSNVALVLEDGGSGVLTYFCSTPGPEVASRQGSKAFEQAANQA